MTSSAAMSDAASASPSVEILGETPAGSAAMSEDRVGVAPTAHRLKLNAPPCRIDEDYMWGRLSASRCPRGCDFVGYVDGRWEHYKRDHNAVYQSLKPRLDAAAAAAVKEAQAPSPPTQRQLAMQAALPIPPDDPPSNIDAYYCNGKLGFNSCPRGCELTNYITSRVLHYKTRHYNVYYALLNEPSWTLADRWIHVHLGDAVDGDRVCARCVPEQRAPIYKSRGNLLNHIQMAHPTWFNTLTAEYTIISKERTPDNIHWIFHNAMASSMAAARAASHQQQFLAAASAVVNVGADSAAGDKAVHATANALFALDAPPSSLDKEYWTGKREGSCPRGCNNSCQTSRTRIFHYKKFHYNVYYALADVSWPPLERWLYAQFGDANVESRVCVRCPRQKPAYRNRIELVYHIQEAHPVDYSSLVRDYCSMSCAVIPDADVHQILMKPAAAAAVAAPAALAVGPIRLDSPPCEVDNEYWSGKLPAGCPRGCAVVADSIRGRREHYKRHHYNVYYSLVKSWMFTPVDRWIYVQFGDANNDGRVCVRCDGDLRKSAYYYSRAELAGHIQSAHPTEFAELSRDYCLFLTGTAGYVPNDGVHAVLLNTTIEPQ